MPLCLGNALEHARDFLRRAPEERLKFYRFSPERVQILDEWEFGEDVFIPATIGR